MSEIAAGLSNFSLCLFLSLFFLSLSIFPKCKNQPLFVAAIFTLVEWVRSWIFTGFPWLTLGYSQVDSSPLAGYIPIMGIYGVSFLLILNSHLIFLFLHKTHQRLWIIFLIIIIGGLLYGVVGMITAVPLYTALKVILKQNFDYVLLLNNDTEVKPNFLTHLEASMNFDENLAATQPLILDFPNKNTIWNAGGSFNSFFGLSKTRFKGMIYKPKLKIDTSTEWISGCCILVKIAVIHEVGLLDNRFFAYFEDVDWSIRMTNLGYKLGVVPKSIIYHHSSGSSKKNNTSNEGNLSPYAHYLNVRNHIYLLSLIHI